MHICYAVIVGASLFHYGGRPVLRVLGVFYPALQLLVIVATGNHFFFDAATGAAVAAVSILAAASGFEVRDASRAAMRRTFGRRTSSVSRTRESLAAVRRSPPPAANLERDANRRREEFEMSVLASAAPAAEQDRRRWIVLAVIVAAQFMVVLDVAIVNVALPTIKTDLNFSQESLQWVVTAYSILFGGVLLLGGRMADLLGRRRLFMAGLAVFTIFSLLDGLAWSEGSLIAFRALQGLGAALLSPAALSILTTTFDGGTRPEPRSRHLGCGLRQRRRCGVLLGGALTSALSWSWIFFINVPVGVLVLVLAPRLVHESRAEVAHRHFDLPGAASITGGLMLLVYAMTRAVQHGWGTGETIGLLAASAALIVAFVVVEARSSAPLLPLRMFRLRTLTGSNIGRAAAGWRSVLAVLPADALHAAGAALLGPPDRGGLRRVDAGRDRVRERLAGGRAPIRGPAGAPGRPAARRGGARPLRPPAGRRSLLLGSLPGVPAQRNRDGVRVHPDDDRRARRSPLRRCRHRVRA